MTCDEVNELITDYLEGELPRRQNRMIAEHLKSCEACREEADSTDQLLTSLSESVEDPGDMYFAGLVPRIMERIENNEGLPWYKKFLSSFSGWQKASLVGAPALAALLLAFVFNLGPLAGLGTKDASSRKAAAVVQTVPIGSTAKTMINPSMTAAAEVTDMTEDQVERLHNVLMVALEDAMNETAEHGYGVAFEDGDRADAFGDLDADGLTEVGDMLENEFQI